MRINNDNLDGSLTRLKSAWDAAMLSIGQSSVIQFIIDVLSEWASTIAECINYVSDLLSSITELEGGVSIIDMIGTAFRLLAIPCKMAWELIAVASSAIVKLINSILDAVRYVWT